MWRTDPPEGQKTCNSLAFHTVRTASQIAYFESAKVIHSKQMRARQIQQTIVTLSFATQMRISHHSHMQRAQHNF